MTSCGPAQPSRDPERGRSPGEDLDKASLPIQRPGAIDGQTTPERPERGFIFSTQNPLLGYLMQMRQAGFPETAIRVIEVGAANWELKNSNPTGQARRALELFAQAKPEDEDVK